MKKLFSVTAVVVIFSSGATLVQSTANGLPAGFKAAVNGALPAVTRQYFNSSVTSISCASSTSCVAVGSYDRNISGGTGSIGFTATQSGSTWNQATAQTNPTPLAGTNLAGAANSALTTTMSDVSCADATDCTKVGTTYAFGAFEAVVQSEISGVWGTTSVVATPYLATPYGTLGAVSCASAGNCVAIGNYQPQSASSGLPFYAVQVNGSWTDGQDLQLPSDQVFGTNASAKAITCVSLTSCVVVGEYQNAGGSAIFSTTFSSGSFGAATNIALPLGDTWASVNSLWCSDANNCVAVGTAGSSTPSHGLAAVEVSGVWSSHETDTNLTDTRLNSVTCSDVTHCTAFGIDTVSSTTHLAVYKDTANVWSELLVGPIATNATASCLSGSCQLSADGLNGFNHADLLSFNGTSLSTPSTFTMPVDVNYSLNGNFYSVSCPSSTTCEALGSVQNLQDQLQAFVTTYVSGVATDETMLTMSEPLSSAVSYSGSISCYAVGNCAASFESDSYGQSLDVQVNGTWQAPLVLPSSERIYAVACTGATFCIAVGTNPVAHIVNGTAVPSGIALTFDGSSWSAQAFVANSETFYGVSCWSSTNCEAVGEGLGGLNNVHGAAIGTELLNGVWQTTKYLAISGSPANQESLLTGVSCVSGAKCLGVGTVANYTSFSSDAIAVTAVGGTWALPSSVGPPFNASSTLNNVTLDAVDCVDISNCVATGNYVDNEGDIQSMVVQGDISGSGLNANTLTAPAPAGVSPTQEQSFDGGVGCLSATNCVLVGSYVTGTNYAGDVSLPDIVFTGTTPAQAPVDVAATGHSGSMQVSWSRGTGGAVPTTYTATVGTKTCTTATFSCTVSGLTNGLSYIVTVVANAASGSSAISDPILVKVVGPPLPPTIALVTPVVGGASVDFTPSTNNGGSSITDYELIATAGTDSQKYGCSIAQSNCYASDLANGVHYLLRVAAINSIGQGPASTAVAFEPIGPPFAPISVEAIAGNQSLTIKWKLASNGGSPITSSTAYANSLFCTTVVTSCTIKGLTNGKKYTVYVTSTNALGTGNVSSSVIGQPLASKPKGPPGSITSLRAKPCRGCVTLTWSAPKSVGTGLASYNICEVSPIAQCSTNTMNNRSANWYVSKTERFSVQAVATDGEVSKPIFITATPLR